MVSEETEGTGISATKHCNKTMLTSSFGNWNCKAIHLSYKIKLIFNELHLLGLTTGVDFSLTLVSKSKQPADGLTEKVVTEARSVGFDLKILSTPEAKKEPYVSASLKPTYCKKWVIIDKASDSEYGNLLSTKEKVDTVIEEEAEKDLKANVEGNVNTEFELRDENNISGNLEENVEGNVDTEFELGDENNGSGNLEENVRDSLETDEVKVEDNLERIIDTEIEPSVENNVSGNLEENIHDSLQTEEVEVEDNFDENLTEHADEYVQHRLGAGIEEIVIEFKTEVDMVDTDQVESSLDVEEDDEVDEELDVEGIDEVDEELDVEGNDEVDEELDVEGNDEVDEELDLNVSCKVREENNFFRPRRFLRVNLFRLTSPVDVKLGQSDTIQENESPPVSVCDHCQKEFSDFSVLRFHVNSHINESDELMRNKSRRRGRSLCSICGKRFRCASNLKRHVSTHRGEKLFKCEICDSRFSDPTSLKRHVLDHSETPFKCTLRDERFESQNRRKHKISHTPGHPAREKTLEEKPHERKPYTEILRKCAFCDFVTRGFFSLPEFNRHILTHAVETPFKCDFCNKMFSKSSDRTEHVKVHNGSNVKCRIVKKPFMCDFCSKGFPSSRERERHVRIHTGEKPFKCDFCDKRFSCSGNRNIHVRIHTEEKPFTCDFCNKGFKSSSDRGRHVRTHTGEKPFPCQFCDRRFIHASSRASHMRTHTRDK